MNIKRKIYDFFVTKEANFRWNLFTKIPKWKGTTNRCYDKEIIVSLTSFPARINDVEETIKSLLMQNMKPNSVILWLASTQFPGKDLALPNNLLILKQYGLEIEWCEDLKSYKKLIPALHKYPASIIVTADDDLIYKHNWLKKLYTGYRNNPNVIWAHRVTKMDYRNGEYISIPGGKSRWDNFSYLNKLTGVGGVLYPPKIFDSEIMNISKFKKICSTNDDIWFWLMAVKNNIKIGVPKKPDIRLVYVGKTQEGESLNQINDFGNRLFWKDYFRVLNSYPEVEEKLQKELIERNKVDKG